MKFILSDFVMWCNSQWHIHTVTTTMHTGILIQPTAWFEFAYSFNNQ